MQAGKLRHRLQIQAPRQVVAEDGGVSDEWQNVVEVWGEVSPLTMREKERAAAIDARLTHRVTVRGRALPPTYRLKFGTRVLQPSSVLDLDERGIQLDILAIEVV